MADGKITIQIDGDDSGLSKKLNNVNTSAGALAKKGMAAAGAAITAFTGAAAAGVAAAVAFGSQYESSFAQVQTIMDSTVVSYEEMSSSIIALSNETGVAATDLSESVYNAISATGDTANAVELVAQATQLATAGFAESADALGVLTTVMNAYGMNASEASKISDSLVTVQNLGVTTIAELSTTMGKGIAAAAAYSVDLYNLESAYISLTKAGINTNESTTYVSAMLKELGDTGSDVAGIIQDQLGMSFGSAMQSGYSLGDVLSILQDSCNGDAEALMNLWGSAEAGKAASAIISQGLSEFNDNLLAVQNSAGATETAYETMTQTLSFQTDLLKTRLQNIGSTVYNYFSDSMVDSVGVMADSFNDLNASMQSGEMASSMEEMASAVSDLTESAAGLVSDVVPSLISGATWLISNLSSVATLAIGGAAAWGAYKIAAIAATLAQTELNLALIANPYGLAAAAIVGLVAGVSALLLAYDGVDGAQSRFVQSSTEIVNEMDSVAESIERTVQSWKDFQNETNTNKESASGLITELLAMIDAYDGTTRATTDIQNAIQRLNELVPGLGLEWDQQANSLNKTTAEMKLLNEQYAAQALYDKANETSSQLEQDKATALEAQAAAYDNLVNAQNAYNFAQKNGDGTAIKRAIVDVNAAREAYDAATVVVATADVAIAANGAEVEKTGDMYDAAAAKTEAYNSAVEANTEASDGSAEASRRLSEEQKQLIYDLNDIRTACSSAGGSADDLWASYNELKTQYDNLETEGQDYRRELTEQALAELELRATTQELAEGLGYLAGCSGLNLSEVSSWLIATGTTATEFAGTVTSALGDVVNGYEKYKTDSQKSLTEARDALQYNAQAQANWVGNMTTLWNQAVASGDSGQMAYVQSLYNMGQESATIVQDMVNGTGASLAEMGAIYSEAAQGAAREAALGLAMESGAVYDASQAVVEQATAGAAAGAVGSGEMMTAGTQDATDYATGITNGTGAVEGAASALGAAAAAAIGGVDFSSTGYNISAGIAAGISSGSSLVTAAAVRVINAAKTAANSAAGIASPAKVFKRETGYWIPAGIAEGIKAGTPLAEKSIKTSVGDVLKAAKAAIIPNVSSVSDMTGRSGSVINNNYEAGRTVAVTVPLSIDGREIAKATTGKIVSQYDFLYS